MAQRNSAVEAMNAASDIKGVTVHRLEAALGVERSAAQRRLATARERGYLVNLEDKRGRPARYVAGDPLPGRKVLLPERVCTAHCTPPCTAFCEGPAVQDGSDDGVCRCAATAWGEESRDDARIRLQACKMTTTGRAMRANASKNPGHLRPPG